MKRLGIDAALLSSRCMDARQLATVSDIVGNQAVFQPTNLWNRLRPRIADVSGLFGQVKRAADESAAQRPRATQPRTTLPLELLSAKDLRHRISVIADRVGANAVHALRIQFEGISAVGGGRPRPVAVSTWGQDLVLTPQSSRTLRSKTRLTLEKTDVLFSDCRRDARHASEWGLRAAVPSHVVPGNFGVDLANFPRPDENQMRKLGLSSDALVTYPRGMRTFVNYRGFVEAARSLIAEGVQAQFLGVGLAEMAPTAGRVRGDLRCIGNVNHSEMLTLLAASAVVVSPAWYDGIPNSVLEGMAAGAIPVCGMVDSVAELEQDGAVISWCDASRADSIADAINHALHLSRDDSVRARNRMVIERRYSTKAADAVAQRAYSDLAALL
jgi:glycosyltransferase involved in cell wall biosynthesis